MARAVAARLGLPYLDTGATYRAATLGVLDRRVDPATESDVLPVVAEIRVEYEDGVVYLDGNGVARAVRTERVTDAVSAVAEIQGVRSLLVDMQRDWVRNHGGAAVVEGRDIGTVVFPGADVKIFLNATSQVRAQRRAGDSEAGGRTVDDIAADLDRRDRYDSQRVSSPLRPAADAVVVDTSDLTIEQVIDRVLQLAAEAAEIS